MLLFRADANGNVGAGHVMRCLSIADAGKKFNQQCLFITANREFENVIALHRIYHFVLNTDYINMEGELEQVKILIRQYQPDVLFVDSYYVTGTYLEKLRNCCKRFGCKLVYIDDVLSFPYSCDVLINYNIYGLDKRADYLSLYKDSSNRTGMPQFLLGTDYAPLRKEFTMLPLRKIKQRTTDILISTGGADFEHIGLKLIREINQNDECSDYTFHFIIGGMNEDRAKIKQLAESKPYIMLHENVQDMSVLMRKCDVAISAAGSTLYELCATQTPAVTYILADNQIPGAEEFERHGIFKNCGDFRKLGDELPKRLVREILILAKDYDKQIGITKKQSIIVDGKGAERIVKEVLGTLDIIK